MTLLSSMSCTDILCNLSDSIISLLAVFRIFAACLVKGAVCLKECGSEDVPDG